MFKYAPFVATVAVAHTPKSAANLAAAGHPANAAYLGALGEAYHAAWTHCFDRTAGWLIDDLNVAEADPAYDNGYYVEYGIQEKVPRVYEIFNELFDGKYFEVPEFEVIDDRLYRKESASRAQVSEHQALSDEVPVAYNGNRDLSWITEANVMSADAEIALYEGVGPRELKLYSTAGKTLKELFYNIQQTSYYCDFTLESAQFSFEKMGFEDLEETVLAERKNTRDMWSYILREQVAPMRYVLSMWTRFNIAESAVLKMIKHFEEDWATVERIMGELPMDQIAPKLNWDNYEQRLGECKTVVEGWVTDFNAWVDICHPQPADRIVKTSDQICLYGMTSTIIKEGEAHAKMMWTDFARPVLAEYQKIATPEDYQQKYDDLYLAIYKTGPNHSFRCEFVFLRTRVRYFEIIPNWEIERVGDDANEYFAEIEEFRNALVNDYGIPAEGIYSDATLAEMKKNKDWIVDFTQRWANAHDDVFDDDKELNRKKLSNKTSLGAKKAMAIYQWYFNMGFNQFSWKEGKAHNFESANFNWSDATAKFVRPHVTSKSRLLWRKRVWREFVKFNFHLKRRI